MKIKPWYKNLQSKLILTGITIYLIILPEVLGISLPTGFIPYIDFGKDIGKRNYIYAAPPETIVLGYQKLIYDGLSISPGIKYNIPRIPLSLQISFFRGLCQHSESYASATFEILPYRKFQNELALGGLYLKNLNRHHNHYGFSSYLNLLRKGNIINLAIVTGIYFERNQVAYKIDIKEYEYFVGGEITLSKWFICPYLSSALIYRLTSYNGSARRIPEKKLTAFISIGIKIQATGQSYISNLINKILAPKRWEG